MFHNLKSSVYTGNIFTLNEAGSAIEPLEVSDTAQDRLFNIQSVP